MRAGSRGLIVVVALLVGACAPFTSWPQVETGVRTYPLLEPFPSLMADSIQYAHEQFETDAPVVLFNLPEGTPAGVYQEIDRRLADAEPLRFDGETAVHIEAVRARGTTAEVDMIVPHPEGRFELVTVYFSREFRGWKLRDARRWRIPREAPPPYYRPAAPHQTIAGTPPVGGPSQP